MLNLPGGLVIAAAGCRRTLTMQQASNESLIAELKAIELWDQMFLQSDEHDEEDNAAWVARRDRQAAIYQQLETTACGQANCEA
jgi:hypothetical protein